MTDYIDETHIFKSEDLRPLIERINRDVMGVVMRTNAYAIRRDPAYDDSYPNFYLAGLENPEPLVYCGARRESIEALIGVFPDLRDPICTQELDGLGSE